MNQPDPHFTDFVRHGSEAAFEELVTRHMGMVHAAARRLLGTRADGAADVAQTVFAQLARRARSLPPDLVVSAWLHRATIRTALNFLRTESRREARERAAADLMETNNASDDFSEAEAAAVSAALMPHIDRAIGELPELDRQALTLCYFEKCRQQEIGERLGLSAGAVQKRLSRALAKLRLRLTRRGVTLSATALTLWLSDPSVQAAPVSLSASALATGALQAAAAGGTTAGAGAGFFHSLFQSLVMTGIKSILIGTALGLVGGSLWGLRNGEHSPSTLTHSPAGSGLAVPRVPADTNGGSGAAARQRFTVPDAARSPEGLVNQLRSLITGPDNEITRQRFAAWLAGVPPDLWKPLITLAHSRLSPGERNRWLPELAAAWGKRDPTGAILQLSAMFTKPDHFGGRLAADAFRSWHESSPAQALNWMMEHQDDPQLTHALPRIISAVAESLAAASHEDALHWASRLQGNELRDAALLPVWEKLKAEKNSAAWGEACGMILRSDDADFKRLGLKQAMDQWCNWGHSGSRGCAAANEWLASLPPSPARGLAAELLLRNVLNLSEYPRKDPPPALLTALAEGDPRTVAGTVIEAIREAPDALNFKARQALLPLIPETDRREVIQQAARHLAFDSAVETYPWSLQSALQWAAELEAPEVRDPLVQAISQRWLAAFQKREIKADPAQWKGTAELPQPVQTILRDTLRNSPPASSP